MAGHSAREENQGRLHGGGGSRFAWVEQGAHHLAGLGFGATDQSSDSRNAHGVCMERVKRDAPFLSSPTQTTHL